MQPRVVHPVGARFGRWTVIAEPDGFRGITRQLCRCDCGTEKAIRSYELPHRTSCTKCKSIIHGASVVSGGRKISDEYRAWQAMKARTKPGHRDRRDYYDRGITVCAEWLGDGGFERFLAHVGQRPGKGYSVGRINNDLGYMPGNVRWEIWQQQQWNRRSNVMLTIDGVTRCVAEWSEVSGVKAVSIRSRLKAGWDPKTAVFAPVMRSC